MRHGNGALLGANSIWCQQETNQCRNSGTEVSGALLAKSIRHLMKDLKAN
jgi:hypothetical protein